MKKLIFSCLLFSIFLSHYSFASALTYRQAVYHMKLGHEGGIKDCDLTKIEEAFLEIAQSSVALTFKLERTQAKEVIVSIRLISERREIPQAEERLNHVCKIATESLEISNFTVTSPLQRKGNFQNLELTDEACTELIKSLVPQEATKPKKLKKKTTGPSNRKIATASAKGQLRRFPKFQTR